MQRHVQILTEEDYEILLHFFHFNQFPIIQCMNPNCLLKIHKNRLFEPVSPLSFHPARIAGVSSCTKFL